MSKRDRSIAKAKITCDRKNPLPSKSAARWVRARMSDSGLRIYKCPAGPHWHLGRMNHK